MRISDWSSDVCSSDLLWRDDAAPRRIALDALEAEEAVERVESGEKQRFATIVEQRAQQMARHVILGSGRHESGWCGGLRLFADGLEQGHRRTHALRARDSQCPTAPHRRLYRRIPAGPLSARGAGPSNERAKAGACLV